MLVKQAMQKLKSINHFFFNERDHSDLNNDSCEIDIPSSADRHPSKHSSRSDHTLTDTNRFEIMRSVSILFALIVETLQKLNQTNSGEEESMNTNTNAMEIFKRRRSFVYS